MHKRLFAATPLVLTVIACLNVVPAWADTGLIPLMDLGNGTYKGFEGGLYPGGRNVPPPRHMKIAMTRAALVQPRDPSGAPSPTGFIGMLSIGMSNTNQEYKAFERIADVDAWRNARVVIVNGGVGGQSAEIIADPNANYWSVVDSHLGVAGITPQQVQVVWLKQAHGAPTTVVFPEHALALQKDLEEIVRILHGRFPNLQLCYLSSRIYGGYAGTILRGEPLSYETGFSVKWLIEDQISGLPALNHDSAIGPIAAPVLLWGPYLWADGTTPRSDGLTWLPADLEADGVHPSPSGEMKVAGLLDAFHGIHPTARPWYAPLARTALMTFNATDDATLSADRPDTPLGMAPSLMTSGGLLPEDSVLLFDTAGAPSPAAHAKLSVRNDSATSGDLELSTDTSWQEETVTWNTAPPPDGGPIGPLSTWSRDSALGLDVTSPVIGDHDTLHTFIMSRDPLELAEHFSRQTHEPPRMVMSVPVDPVMLDVALEDSTDPSGVLLRWNDVGTGLYQVKRGDSPDPEGMYYAKMATVSATQFHDVGDLPLGRIFFYLVQPGGLVPQPVVVP